MRLLSRKRFKLERLLTVLLVLAVLSGVPLLVCAQESTHSPDTGSSSQPPHKALSFRPSAEQIGDAMLGRRRYHEAIEAYKKVPNPSPGVWNKLGVSYQEMLDLKNAMRCYKESLLLKPLNAWTLNNLGSVYDSLGDHSRAERMYRQALKVDPTLAVAAMNLGTNLMVQNKHREGFEMYRRAAALDPAVFDGVDATLTTINTYPQQTAAINYYKARSFAQAGKSNLAIKYLRRAIDEGFVNLQMVARDSSFAKLRESPAFQRLQFEERRR